MADIRNSAMEWHLYCSADQAPPAQRFGAKGTGIWLGVSPMNTIDEPVTAGGISDAAVRVKTGRGWQEWFAILDAFDVRTNGHKAAAHHIATEHHCGDWWSQMVTVTYEQAHGLRAKHQTPTGYQASVSRTFDVTVETLYAAWHEPARAAWLPDPLTVRKATPPKSMRIGWPDGSSVAVYFYKGERRSSVTV